MPQPTLTLLVGAYFRPPAKLVLAALPNGTPLALRAEPCNPYDEQAIAVYVRVDEVPEDEHEQLVEQLPSCGWTLEQLLAEGELQLGYLASEGNKQLSKYQLTYCNKHFVGHTSGLLRFAPDGQPLVEEITHD